MELKDLLGSRTLPVAFGDQIVNVTYRLAENVVEKREGMFGRSVVDELVRYVESWDITADGEPIPITKERVEKIPMPVLRKILLAILDDAWLGLGEVSSNSDAG